jgi:colicin import membrane protein
MPSALDRIDNSPPHEVGAVRALGLALLIHAALIAALTWGVNWKRTDSAAVFGAELWSSAPQEAAPKLVEPPPAPPPEPAPKVQDVAPPEPKVDIALAQEKKRQQLKNQQIAQEKIERDKAKLQQAQADKAKQLKAEQLAKAEKLAKAEQLAKDEQAKADALKAVQLEQAAAAQREDNLKRMNDLSANTGGSPQGGNSRATLGGKGSSKTYSAIARAAVIPHVVFTEAFDGNPLAKVEVRLQSNGAIISARVVQPSGNINWDNAVLNAVRRTGVMPKDVDGTLPDTILILEFKPRF